MLEKILCEKSVKLPVSPYFFWIEVIYFTVVNKWIITRELTIPIIVLVQIAMLTKAKTCYFGQVTTRVIKNAWPGQELSDIIIKSSIKIVTQGIKSGFHI